MKLGTRARGVHRETGPWDQNIVTFQRLHGVD